MPRLLVGPRKEEEEENVESFPLPPRAALRGTTSRKAAPRGTASMTLRTTTTTMVQKERVEKIGFNLSGVFCLRYFFFFDFRFSSKTVTILTQKILCFVCPINNVHLFSRKEKAFYAFRRQRHTHPKPLSNLHSLGVPKKYFGRTPTWAHPCGKKKKMEKMGVKNKHYSR